MRRLLVWLTVSLLVPRPAAAAAFTINFDTDTNGNAVPHGTSVETLYSSLGVTFTGEPTGGCGAGNQVSASSQSPLGQSVFSKPNWVSPCPGTVSPDFGESQFGVIRADITPATTHVCINVAPDDATQTGRCRRGWHGRNPRLPGRIDRAACCRRVELVVEYNPAARTLSAVSTAR